MSGKGRYLLAGVVGLLAAVAALMDAGGNAFLDRSPMVALSFDPDNEMAHQAAADAIIGKGIDRLNLVEARAHTLRALEIAPGLGHMLRSYALLAEAKLVSGDPIRIMTAAAQFSKRDLPTQLWLIQNLAKSGDIDATIRHYDDALNANRSISGLLYPLLARAVADDALRPAIVKLLATRPEWDDDFYFHLASTGELAVYMPQLLEAMGAAAANVPAGTREMAAQTLFRTGEIGLAEHIAVPASARRDIGDFINAEDRVLPPFAWKFRPMGTVSVNAQKDGSLAIDIDGGAGGIVAERIVAMRGGQLGVEGLVDAPGVDPDRVPWLKLECVSGDPGDLSIRPVLIRPGLFRYSQDAPMAQCDYARLLVVAPSNFGGDTVHAEIKSLRMTMPSIRPDDAPEEAVVDDGADDIVIPPLPGPPAAEESE